MIPRTISGNDHQRSHSISGGGTVQAIGETGLYSPIFDHKNNHAFKHIPYLTREKGDNLQEIILAKNPNQAWLQVQNLIQQTYSKLYPRLKELKAIDPQLNHTYLLNVRNEIIQLYPRGGGEESKYVVIEKPLATWQQNPTTTVLRSTDSPLQKFLILLLDEIPQQVRTLAPQPPFKSTK